MKENSDTMYASQIYTLFHNFVLFFHDIFIQDPVFLQGHPNMLYNATASFANCGGNEKEKLEKPICYVKRGEIFSTYFFHT